MVQDEDLDAAVADGIIAQAQVDRLRAFALRRLPQSAAERVDEERFRFLKGFNDSSSLSASRWWELHSASLPDRPLSRTFFPRS